MLVAVVIDPAKGPAEDNLEAQGITGKPCRHLKGDKPGNYSCAVHDYSWYKETPCHEHTQVEHTNSPCRTGLFTLRRKP